MLRRRVGLVVLSAVLMVASAGAYAWIPLLVAAGEGAVFLWRGATALKFIDVAAPAIGIGSAYVLSQAIDRISIGKENGAWAEIDPRDGAQRSNPDKTRYNDPAAGQQDVTPKSSYVPGSTLPGNGSLAAIVAVGVGSYTYVGTNGKFQDYQVLQSYVAGSGLSQIHADAVVKSNTEAAHAGWSWSRGYYQSSTDWRVVWYRARDLTCATGYSVSSGTCLLTNAEAVTKPSNTTPCEVIVTSGKFVLDAKNPSCASLGTQLSAVGNKITYADSATNSVSVTREADGTGAINVATGAGTYSMPFTGATSTVNPVTANSVAYVPYGTGSGSTSGTGTGTSTGTGTGTGTGSGTSTSPTISWICGVAPLPPCAVAVDGTGINTTAPEIANTSQMVSDVFHDVNQIANDPAGAFPALPTLSWNFALPSSCSTIATPAFAPALSEINICQYQPVFHSIMSVVWVLGGLFGSIGLFWRNVFSS